MLEALEKGMEGSFKMLPDLASVELRTPCSAKETVTQLTRNDINLRHPSSLVRPYDTSECVKVSNLLGQNAFARYEFCEAWDFSLSNHGKVPME